MASSTPPHSAHSGDAPLLRTPDWMAPLSRELESVIAEKNLFSVKSRRRLLKDLDNTSKSIENTEMRRLREKAVAELLSSEKTYLRHLELVKEFFMDPLEGRREWFSQSDYVTIFGDLPSIIQVNKELLSSLETSSDAIGAVFLELSPYLKFYSTYAQDFQTSAKLVERYSDKHRGFRTWLSNQESRPEVQMKLNALLITPVQRIPRYKMLLEDVIKNTPECHPDKRNLTEALSQIDAVAWHINDQLREHENGLKMVDIQKSLQGCWPKIITPGRRLVLQGNLMKVPRAGGSGQPRYFVLFSDMLMYCKIKVAGLGTLVLPKSNSLECGCMMPLKHTKVETLVGKGVFKVKCQKEELILYSSDGRSEEWVDTIVQTIEKHKKDAATLRKESSRREPLKRPDILKMRRDSLSQIMMNNSRHRMTLRDRTDASTPSPNRLQSLISPMRKKRQAPDTPKNTASPSKLKRLDEESGSEAGTPRKLGTDSPVRDKENQDAFVFASPKPVTRSAKKKMAAPKPPQTPPVELRKKKIHRPSWKSLSLSRKDKLIQEHTPSTSSDASALFRSPSLFEEPSTTSEQPPSVMTSYLSGKICPLTPSQKQTDISHLVQQELKERLKSPKEELKGFGSEAASRRRVSEEEEDESQQQLVTASFFQHKAKEEDSSGSYCSIM